jgi:tRNA threonylcarbamoyladenosine biosynthesis protein TsaE
VPIEHPRTSTSEPETREIGRTLGALLRAGDVLLLEGALGAGKTTLIRAIAEGLGIDPRSVASPTFVVVHEYRNPAGPAPEHPDLIHVDAYRLGGESELDSLGWDAVLSRVQGASPTAALVIEWPERLGHNVLQGAPAARIRLEHAPNDSREFFLSLPDSWATRPGLADLLQRRPTSCPITGAPVRADSPTWPFASERARLADLHRWFSGRYTISRDLKDTDFTEGE